VLAQKNIVAQIKPFAILRIKLKKPKKLKQ